MCFVLATASLLLCTSIVAANTCPRGSFWDSETSQCTLCPPGSYQYATNATSCILCPPGEFLPYAGAQSGSVCHWCPAGTFSSAGASSCTPCAEGTSSSEFSSRCVTCPTGTFLATAEFFGNPSGCEVCYYGYADEQNLEECKTCPPGTAAPRGATSIHQCTPCPAGTASDGYNECHECDSGTFSAHTGSSSCTQCPVGSKSEKDFGSTKCVPCQPGQYGRLVQGYSTVPGCVDCPEHTQSYSAGQRFCRRIDGPCPSGYIETSDGDCVRCEPDERYDAEREQCVPCPENQGSVGGLPLQCAPCDEVRRAGIDSTNCTPFGFFSHPPVASETCDPGTYILDTDSARFCLPCLPGTYSSKSNSAECVRCPDGTVSTDYGATQCEPCPEGMIPDLEPTECVDRVTDCPIDTQLAMWPPDSPACVPNECTVSEDGSFSCPPCSGSFSNTYSFDGCEPCPGNQVRHVDFSCGCRGALAQNLGVIDGTCSQCPAGSYGELNTDTDENKCVKCPAGTYRVVATRDEMLSVLYPRGSAAQPCQKCAAGFVARQDGATECEKCFPGTFTYGIGDTECLSLGAPSAEAHFNHPLDLDVKAELERFPKWWQVVQT